MVRAYISVGSNIDRERNVAAALDALAELFGELVLSSVYESEAVGFEGDPFLNMVVGVDTERSAAELVAAFRSIEDALGRERDTPRFSARTLDLDLLTHGDVAGVVEGVRLPRAEIRENAFVLGPLAEIAAHELHPDVGSSYQELWSRFDTSGQRIRPVDFDWGGSRISESS